MNLGLIHISFAGPIIEFNADKVYRIEDHCYCGPIFCDLKGDPLKNQPRESAAIWRHVNAWYQQGKKVREIEGKKWAVYETSTQKARRDNVRVRPSTPPQEAE